MERLKRILIAGRTYPYKIDLNVLEAIQERYGSISQFERDLLGYRFKKDEKGAQVYDQEGEPIMYRVEPSIKAIRAVLPEAINEGLAIEAEETGREFASVSEDHVMRNCSISYELLSRMLHDEFKRCFETKK
ncbi:MAG: hypothetical protein NC517_09825 [Firmicutes bacterium]|nr:hypothetical protein [Bacillota bacterium]